MKQSVLCHQIFGTYTISELGNLGVDLSALWLEGVPQVSGSADAPKIKVDLIVDSQSVSADSKSVDLAEVDTRLYAGPCGEKGVVGATAANTELFSQLQKFQQARNTVRDALTGSDLNFVKALVLEAIEIKSRQIVGALAKTFNMTPEKFVKSLSEGISSTGNKTEEVNNGLLRLGEIAGLASQVAANSSNQEVKDLAAKAKAFSDAVSEFQDKTEKAMNVVENVDKWLDRVTIAMKVVEAGKNLAGSYKDADPEAQALLGLSQVLDLAQNIVPPGVKDMLDFYSQAVKAIAGGIEFIADKKGNNNLDQWAACKGHRSYITSMIPNTGSPYGGAWARQIVAADENGRNSKALRQYDNKVQGHQ